MKLKVLLGIIGVALICVGLVAVLSGGETGCQPKEEAPRYSGAQVITIAEKHLMATRDNGLSKECFRYVSKASYEGNGIWEITVDRRALPPPTSIEARRRRERLCSSPIPPIRATFIFDEKTGALH